MNGKWKLHRSIGRRLSDDSGAATVEFVLWLPVMAALFGLVVDTSIIFGDKSQILRIVQDVNRAVSIGHVPIPGDSTRIAAAEALILADIDNIAPNASAETTLVDGIITTTVTIPVSDLSVTNLIDVFHDFNVTVSAQHLSEN